MKSPVMNLRGGGGAQFVPPGVFKEVYAPFLYDISLQTRGFFFRLGLVALYCGYYSDWLVPSELKVASWNPFFEPLRVLLVWIEDKPYFQRCSKRVAAAYLTLGLSFHCATRIWRHVIGVSQEEFIAMMDMANTPNLAFRLGQVSGEVFAEIMIRRRVYAIAILLANIVTTKVPGDAFWNGNMFLLSIPPQKLKYLVMMIGFTIMCIGGAMK